MADSQRYPKRLIEVDLPIRMISEHARREKSIRHGHISTLHIWWARRPLAACRAVVLASLLPDPADPQCPTTFRTEVAVRLKALRDRRGGKPRRWDDPEDLRHALLDLIADFSNWDASNDPDFLETSRALVAIAHQALGGAPGKPLVIDPFAGGGTIPVEAMRVGAEAYASDLNPIPVLLNTITLEYIPKYGRRLVDAVDEWGRWIHEAARKEMAGFYPAAADGSTPIAYIWARTIRCQGPACGVEVPLIRSLWLARKDRRSVALRFVPAADRRSVGVEIIEGVSAKAVEQGSVRRGSATCPVCGYTTPVANVRSQLKERRSGSADARLIAVVLNGSGEQGTLYRLPEKKDVAAAKAAADALSDAEKAHSGPWSLIPDERFPAEDSRAFTPGVYGVRVWGDLFLPRQNLLLSVLTRLVHDVAQRVSQRDGREFGTAVATLLSMALGKLVDYQSTLCVWRTARSCVAHTFGRQALPITWDFGEMNPFAGSAGDWSEACSYLKLFLLQMLPASSIGGHVERVSATALPLPDDSVSAVITDPPYYDAVPYADLSDYFYVWHKRAIGHLHPSLFVEALSPKAEEAVVNPLARRDDGLPRDNAFYEAQMRKALAEARRVLAPTGIGVVVFAHKSTSGWEALLQAVLDSGWIITASWPIDTERPGRLRANDSAALASSIHLVCRPRERMDGSVEGDEVGDWRAVLEELPRRIRAWLPRLAHEGVVGADAIFACLGPALEIFSRYARVEKISSERVELREYLEHVWAAVSREALNMIFEGADTAGLEPDARLTAMWLWTIASSAAGSPAAADELGGDVPAEDVAGDEDGRSSATSSGFALEFDAARKIAQGLGVRLDDHAHLVEVKGDKARLLAIAERTKQLFGRAEAVETNAKKGGKKSGRPKQTTLFAEIDEAATPQRLDDVESPRAGTTTLDRIHQAMMLFGAGRSEALKRFLVEDGVGKQGQFWTLAQSLSALYPSGTDEKRWVDGVLARKKGLRF